jgi:hypothetical protein
MSGPATPWPSRSATPSPAPGHVGFEERWVPGDAIPRRWGLLVDHPDEELVGSIWI